VSAGDFSGCHTVGLKIDGTLWSWGNNAVGQIGDTTIIGRCCPTLVAGSETTCSGGTTWCAASAGSFFTIGLRE
jgi:alpha-tubulin suppressor-like RCC1 family protein